MDVIRRLRRRLNIRKIGHAGTLDPLATGLMLVGVGAGTKKLAELIKLDKEYIADVRVGERTSTGDLEGVVVDKKEVTELSVAEVTTVLASIKGDVELPVSAYSAIKVGGVPMYKRARQAEKIGGVVTEVPTRIMKVLEAELLYLKKVDDCYIAQIRFAVGSGTYIRSLAEELGSRLGYPATLQDLRRTKVGPYAIDDAETLE